MDLVCFSQFASTTLVLLVGVVIVVCCSCFNIGVVRRISIYFWHTLFCFIYYLYVSNYGGDAIAYYSIGLSGESNFRLGTSFVYFFTGIFVNKFHLSLLGAFFVYNIFGTIGLLAFDDCLQTVVRNKKRNIRRFATLIVFLPSVSFWSSAIGKDSISFMAIGLALWAAVEFDKRVLLMAFSIGIMLLVRPHIAALMLIALCCSIIVSRNLSLCERTFLGLVSIVSASVIFFIAINYVGLDGSLSVAGIADYVASRQSYNMDGGGGIDISSMPLLVQLFTYLFRPLPFEVHNIFAFAASLDNVILLTIFIVGILGRFRNQQQKDNANRSFLWFYFLSSWVILSITTANLGISVRQKWMFVPVAIYLLFSTIGRPLRQTTIARQQQVKAIPVSCSSDSPQVGN